MRSTIFAAAAFAVLASAQLNYTTSGPLNVTISQIPASERTGICNSQFAQCPLICDGPTSANTCDPDTLSYNCTCASGNTPNISDYQQTVPGQICRIWVGNCVANHPDDGAGQAACRTVICGNRTLSAPVPSRSSSASAGPTSTSAGSGGGSSTPAASGASSTPTPSTGAAIAMHVAENYGTGIVGAGLLAVFGLAL